MAEPTSERDVESESESEHGESLLTVLLALGANVAVAVAKAVAGVLTGSAALLSESAHSVADCGTELFLLTALRRSAKPADASHPFGYGKERYFWSLLAAVSIFTAGALFALYQGVETLTGHPEDHRDVLVGYLVLARYDTVWHLMNIAVDPLRRREGIARAMLQEMFERAGPDEQYTLEVRTSNAPAIALYERYGFRRAGRRPRYYRDTGEDAMIMWRTSETISTTGASG